MSKAKRYSLAISRSHLHRRRCNDAAHIEAKTYDNIGREEAEDSIELAQEILKSLYQLQGLVSRLQARKSTP